MSECKYELALDTVVEELDDFLHLLERASSQGLSITKFVKEGSGGGWPEITFCGTKEALSQFLNEDFCPSDPLAVEDLMEVIEPVE